MNRIKKGDQVVVTTGNKTIKGQTGEVLRVDGERVFVSNLNLVKRHAKPNPQAGQAGGIVQREASIHISNVMLLNPVTGALPPRCSRMESASACSAPAVRLSK